MMMMVAVTVTAARQSKSRGKNEDREGDLGIVHRDRRNVWYRGYELGISDNMWCSTRSEVVLNAADLGSDG